jgi:hypothetical protein
MVYDNHVGYVVITEQAARAYAPEAFHKEQ